MPTYGKKEFKESNVNYLNKDFGSLKNSLIQYAKSYFPNTYQDFNETSPGMMLLEMSAYVGDVMSFYIDQQYREMLLPLAEERRNIINIARMFGYKVKPIYAAHTHLKFTQIVNSITDNESNVDYDTASVFDKGIQIKSTSNDNVIFETLDVIDFTIAKADDTNIVHSTETTSGLVSKYKLERIVKAISSETKTITFKVSAPTKFLRLTLPDINVIDIVSCVDSNNNKWYEVDYLAQDRVPVETHYSLDDNRDTAYSDIGDDPSIDLVSVPYSLSYIQTNKRFVTEVNEDNTTSLRFGNGIKKDGEFTGGNFLDLEQAGITIPGQTSNLEDSVDILLNDEYDTLGETPNQTTLTVTYRVGGGMDANVSSGDLVTVHSGEKVIRGDNNGSINSVTNESAATGGKSEETIDEIREKTKSHFATQNRAVTKHDYKARILNMSSKFGAVAKVFVTRLVPGGTQEFVTNVQQLINLIMGGGSIEDAQEFINGNNFEDEGGEFGLGTVSINILSFDKNKNLVGNPQAFDDTGTQLYSDYVPKILHTNINRYLSEYRILTDEVMIRDGYIINFGVIFDVVSHKNANKSQVKLKCIEAIKKYFRIDNMQFNQPIYVSQLEYELMAIDGVRGINQLCITQDQQYDRVGNPMTSSETLSSETYLYSINANGDVTTDGNTNYGWKYDFSQAYRDGVILPPSPENPAVFELKYPNRNIIGVVR